MSVDNPNLEERRCPECGYATNPEDTCLKCGYHDDVAERLTPIQALVASSYCGGEYRGLKHLPLLSGVGDGLFEFLMDELGPDNDIGKHIPAKNARQPIAFSGEVTDEDWERARERLETIYDEVEGVLKAFREREARKMEGQ
jgi:hypothetical protein